MKQIISRFMPHKLRSQLSGLYSSLTYNIGVYSGKRDPLFPPLSLHGIGGGDYIQTGEEFLQYFTNIGELKPQDKVLEIGCGTGRMARPLTKYLESGSYDGTDIVAPSVKWCQKTYARYYKNFNFHFTDIYNKEYNPTGNVKASDYKFPFEDSTFDFVFLTSVFTHMLPQDMENYISEIARVLKSGGRSFITYFLINPESSKLIEQKLGSFTFGYDLQGCYAENEDVPEAALAYDESKVRELYDKYKLNILEPIKYGSWCGRKNALSHQDICIADKS